jgi:hypothetical protein
MTRANQIWIEQVDAATLAEGEEVTLMDWGNAIIKVGETEFMPRSAAMLTVGARF